MRAVLDPNVLVSGLLSSNGRPAQLLRRWSNGDFDLVVSNLLLAELERVLSYPRIRKVVPELPAMQLIGWLSHEAVRVGDPSTPPAILSRDSGGHYLLALREAAAAFLVTGDQDLLALRGQAPVFSPAEFNAVLDEVTSS